MSGARMIRFSPDEINAIADALAERLMPMLAPGASRGAGESTALEIARVRATGVDPVSYLKERAKTRRRRG